MLRLDSIELQFSVYFLLFLFWPHFSGEGGTIYSTGFFCSVNFDRSIYSSYRVVSGIIKSPSRLEYEMKKIFWLSFFLQGVIEV